MLNILHLDSSVKGNGSISRLLSQETVETLNSSRDGKIVHRDLSVGMPHIDSDWVAATQTAPEERSAEQHAAMQLSEQLVKELRAADILVMGVAFYNFSIPSTLKAWVDHVCRARITFRYVDGKPEGLLIDKKAIVLISTGGTPIGSDIDFASDYIRHVLGFVGIKDVHIAVADRIFANREGAMMSARRQIADAVKSILKQEA